MASRTFRDRLPGPHTSAWLLVVLVYAGMVIVRGPISGVDSSSYSRWADALIASGFNYPQFFANNTFMVPLPLYSVWLTVVAVAKLAAGDSWPVLIMAANVVAIGVIARAVLSIQRSVRGQLAACAALLVSGDLLLFSAYVLSDVIFAAACTVTLVALIQRHPVRATGTAVLACVTRPTSPPLVALVLARLTGLFRHTWLLAMSAIAIVVAHGVFIQHPEWTPASLAQWFDYIRSGYTAGAVITDRPPMYLGAMTTLPEIVGLTVLKWIAFFTPWAPGYSLLHCAINLLFFLPIYTGCALSIKHAEDREAVATLVLYAVLVSGFHALQEIDFDHRFRLPVLPALIMLATLPWRIASKEPPRLG